MASRTGLALHRQARRGPASAAVIIFLAGWISLTFLEEDVDALFVFRVDFSRVVVRAVAGIDDAPLQAALDRLADADILLVHGVPPDADYRFKHALIRSFKTRLMRTCSRGVFRIGRVNWFWRAPRYCLLDLPPIARPASAESRLFHAASLWT